MRENHPFFDRPLFLISRDSKLRQFCRQIVHARYGYSEDGSEQTVSNGTLNRRKTVVGSLFGAAINGTRQSGTAKKLNQMQFVFFGACQTLRFSVPKIVTFGRLMPFIHLQTQWMIPD